MMNNIFLKLLTPIVLVAVMAMPQEVVAKIKNTKYLGHQYYGEVNNQKIPEGEGQITINDLVIKGIFAGQMVTDATIEKAMGSNKRVFKGAVTFDESDKITMKAGGVMTTPYFFDGRTGTHFAYPTTTENVETFTQDVVISTADFFPKGAVYLKFNCSETVRSYLNNMGFDVSKMGIPNNLSYTGLAKYNNHNMIYELNARSDYSVVECTDYKGRTWKYNNNLNSNPVFMVEYPNGDFIKVTSKYIDDGGYMNGEWQKRFKNDVVLKVEFTKSDLDPWISLPGVSFRMSKSKAGELWEKKEFILDENDVSSIKLTDISRNTSPNKVLEVLKTKLFPYMANHGDGAEFSFYDSQFYEYGKYSNGRVYSKAEEEQRIEREDAKKQQQEEQRQLQSLYNKFGKQYVDAWNRGNVIVGMPEGLVKMFKHELREDSGTYRLYYIYNGNLWNAKVVYAVWVKNGKVSTVRHY